VDKNTSKASPAKPKVKSTYGAAEGSIIDNLKKEFQKQPLTFGTSDISA
jgi:hypothetical protein